GHRVDADLPGRARQRIEYANLDLLLCLRRCCAAQHCDARESDNSEPHCSAPFAFVFVPLVRIRTGSLLRLFPRKRESRVPVCGLWVPAAFAGTNRESLRVRMQNRTTMIELLSTSASKARHRRCDQRPQMPGSLV